ncbi:putative nicotinate-nucleotide adenylyltransferase [mine drainage metagenome]|uniref:Putative nicotinate-nucleotide adenylyltransferase n=2 Tax=mine drainage metagenome TaxID=410659 RepID=T1A3R8_9ZZZZ
MKAIGLFGGSFDPAHLGHLRAAVEVFEALALDELRFIPAAASRHKPPPRAPGAIRKRWLELATRTLPGFTVDDRELRRGGFSFTSETLSEIRREEPGATLYWVLGSDAFAGLDLWHEAESLGRLAHWVVLARPGFPSPERLSPPRWSTGAIRRDPRDLARGGTGGILALQVTPIGISASAVRTRIASGGRIDYLVPEAIRHELLDGSYYGADAKTAPD